MEKRFTRTTLAVTASLLVWAADFLFIYVFAALACARGYAHDTVFGFSIVPFVSAVATVIAAGASLAVLVAGAQRGVAAPADEASAPIFLGRLTATVAMLALIATAFIGLPGLLVRGVCS